MYASWTQKLKYKHYLTNLWNSGNAKGSSTQYKSVPSGYASSLQVVAQTSRGFQKVIVSSLWVCDLQAPYSTRTTYLYRHTYHYLQNTCKSSFRQSANCCGIVSRLRCSMFLTGDLVVSWINFKINQNSDIIQQEKWNWNNPLPTNCVSINYGKSTFAAFE